MYKRICFLEWWIHFKGRAIFVWGTVEKVSEGVEGLIFGFAAKRIFINWIMASKANFDKKLDF